MVTVLDWRAVSQSLHWQSVNQKSSIIISSNNPAVYSKISLKSVELSVESMEKESIGLGNERPFEGEKFTYFRPSFSMQLFRIEKVKL